MTRAQAWLFIASGLAVLLAVSIASGKEHWPKRALMKGAVGVCVAANAVALAPCANADDDSFLANLAISIRASQPQSGGHLAAGAA